MSALIPLKKVILIQMAETTPGVTDIKGTVITPTSHIAITAKRETIVDSITHKGTRTITAAADAQVSALAPVAATRICGDGIGGALDPGLIPAAAPLLPEGNLIMTSLVGRGSTKEDI